MLVGFLSRLHQLLPRHPAAVARRCQPCAACTAALACCLRPVAASIFGECAVQRHKRSRGCGRPRAGAGNELSDPHFRRAAKARHPYATRWWTSCSRTNKPRSRIFATLPEVVKAQPARAPGRLVKHAGGTGRKRPQRRAQSRRRDSAGATSATTGPYPGDGGGCLYRRRYRDRGARSSDEETPHPGARCLRAATCSDSRPRRRNGPRVGAG